MRTSQPGPPGHPDGPQAIAPVSCSGPPAGTTALLEQESVTGDQVRALAWASMGMASERFSSTNRVSR